MVTRQCRSTGSTTSKPNAAPHGPSEGQDKPAKSKPASAVKPPAKKTKIAARKPLGGAAASTIAKTPWELWSSNPDAAITALCDAIVDGGHLNQYTKDHGLRYATVRSWIAADAERASMYARAREDRSDHLADEIVAISDEAEVVARHDGEEVRLSLDAALVARNRLRVDARKWVAAKLKPRVYGEKLDLTQTVTIRDLPDDELKVRAAKLLALLSVAVGDGRS